VLLPLLPLLPLLAGFGCSSGPPKPIDPSFKPITRAAAIEYAKPDGLAAFEAGEDEVYRLGYGDRLNVTVWGRPDLGGRKIVGPDGRVSIPIAGTVKVDLLSREEAGDAIGKALAPYYESPSVGIEVEEYLGNRIVLLGRVENPGVIRFDGPPTLVEALAKAGALPVLDKKAKLTRCAVIRGRERLLWVDLKQMMNNADLRYNIRLKQNDLVYIPDSDDTVVFVLGEVRRPGAYSVTGDMTMLDALAQAGGVTADAASSKIRLIRPNSGMDVEIPMNRLLDPKERANVALEERDIVWVPKSGLAKFGYLIQQITPVGNLVLVGSAAANTFGGTSTTK
jgi:polysaccharide export outer membrane protein